MTRVDATSAAAMGLADCHTVPMLVIAHRGASRGARRTRWRRSPRRRDGGRRRRARRAPGPLGVPVRPSRRARRRSTTPHRRPRSTTCSTRARRMWVNVEIKNVASDGGFDPTMSIADRTVETLRRRGERGRTVADLLVLVGTIEACRRRRRRSGRRGCHDRPARSTGSSPRDTSRCTRACGRSTRRRSSVATTAGMRVNTWTCDDPERMAELAGGASTGSARTCRDRSRRSIGRLGRGDQRSGERRDDEPTASGTWVNRAGRCRRGTSPSSW